MSANGPSMLQALIAEQRELESRIHDLHASPRETLAVGASLLAFADREDEAFSALTPLLEPAVRAQLAAEHQRIADDLDLLDWLLQTAPTSPDVSVLTASRDGRCLRRSRGR